MKKSKGKHSKIKEMVSTAIASDAKICAVSRKTLSSMIANDISICALSEKILRNREDNNNRNKGGRRKKV